MAKSRMNFAINITGLAVGLAACILVILFVKDELTYDRFHSKANDIYRPYAIEKEDDQTLINSVTPGPLGPQMLEEIPEVKDYVIVGQFTDLVKKGELIATLKNIFGDVVKEYYAPENGVVIGKSVSPINHTGGRILHLGIRRE